MNCGAAGVSTRGKRLVSLLDFFSMRTPQTRNKGSTSGKTLTGLITSGWTVDPKQNHYDLQTRASSARSDPLGGRSHRKSQSTLSEHALAAARHRNQGAADCARRRRRQEKDELGDR